MWRYCDLYFLRRSPQRARQTTEYFLARNSVILTVACRSEVNDARFQLAIVPPDVDAVKSETSENDSLRVDHLQLVQQVPAQVDPVEPAQTRGEEQLAKDQFTLKHSSETCVRAMLV